MLLHKGYANLFATSLGQDYRSSNWYSYQLPNLTNPREYLWLTNFACITHAQGEVFSWVKKIVHTEAGVARDSPIPGICGHKPYMNTEDWLGSEIRSGQWLEVSFLSACACLCCVWLLWPHQAPSVHGTFQGIILDWVSISFSRIFSLPRDQTHVFWVSCTGRWGLSS